MSRIANIGRQFVKKLTDRKKFNRGRQRFGPGTAKNYNDRPSAKGWNHYSDRADENGWNAMERN